MGMYTKFSFMATLKKELPAQLREFLSYRFTMPPDGEEQNETPLDDHPFFRCSRWDSILDPYRHGGGNACSRLNETPAGTEIAIETQLKNYESEIEWFLVWIAPWIDTARPCTIYYRYEEQYEDPGAEECGWLITALQAALASTSNAEGVQQCFSRPVSGCERFRMTRDERDSLTRYLRKESLKQIPCPASAKFGL